MIIETCNDLRGLLNNCTSKGRDTTGKFETKGGKCWIHLCLQKYLFQDTKYIEPYSDSIPTVYRTNDQASMAQFLSSNMHGGRVTMDYQVDLFQTMFSKHTHSDLTIIDGKLYNHRASSYPIFIHYNGMAKVDGHCPAEMSISSMYRTLLGDDGNEEDQWLKMKRLTTILDPSLQRDSEVNYQGLCEKNV